VRVISGSHPFARTTSLNLPGQTSQAASVRASRPTAAGRHHDRRNDPRIWLASALLLESRARDALGDPGATASSWTRPGTPSSPARTVPACQPGRALQPRGRGGHRHSSRDQDSVL